MQEELFKNLKKGISSDRLVAYGAHDNADHVILISRYMWNIALCESLYPILQISEVSLRNLIHDRLTIKLGTDNWFDVVSLTEYQNKEIEKAEMKLERLRKIKTPGALVAELNFGFWTSFFNKRMRGSNLTSFIMKGFKGVPKDQKNLPNFESKWESVRELRNRVFHHERINHWKDLKDQHSQLISMITWINPSMKIMIEMIDRFPDVHEQGIDPWKSKFEEWVFLRKGT